MFHVKRFRRASKMFHVEHFCRKANTRPIFHNSSMEFCYKVCYTFECTRFGGIRKIRRGSSNKEVIMAKIIAISNQKGQ